MAHQQKVLLYCVLPTLLAILLLTAGCLNRPVAGDSIAPNRETLNTDNPSQLDVIDNLEGVSMNVKNGGISATGLTLNLVNQTDRPYMYGAWFCLEHQVDGSWYQISYAAKGNVAFAAIGYQLEPGVSKSNKMDWSWLYGQLPPGNYRIVKDVLDSREPGDYDKYYLTAEFTIK